MYTVINVRNNLAAQEVITVVNLFSIKALSQPLLTVLAVVGMLVPASAKPCCGCCSPAAEATRPAEDTQPCCAKASDSCCQAKPAGESTLESTTCCVGQPNCAKPECRCQTIPSRAVTPVAREATSSSSTDSSQYVATLTNPPKVQNSTATATLDRVLLTHTSGGARLHAQLCVWLN